MFRIRSPGDCARIVEEIGKQKTSRKQRMIFFMLVTIEVTTSVMRTISLLRGRFFFSLPAANLVASRRRQILLCDMHKNDV
jgi:hypothetical protein